MSLQEELEKVKRRIDSTEEDLAEAKEQGKDTLIENYSKLLAGLQEKENRLAAGNSVFLFVAEYFCCRLFSF